MAVKIITDSTSDLSQEIADDLGITIVPLNVHLNTEVYRDRIDLTTEDFYKRLSLNGNLPTTSAPAPGLFADVYDRVAENADGVLVITISSKLSATYEAAVTGSKVRKSKARLEVIDSLWAVSGLGLIAISAAKAAKTGSGIDEVINIVNGCIKRLDYRIAFDTLDYLKKGGRIGAAQAFLGSALKFNPILTIRNGITEPVARVRGRTKSLDYLYNFATSFSDVEEMAIEDATTSEEADNLAERIKSQMPGVNIYRMKVSPVIGTHVGPHVMGVSVLPRS